LLPRASAALDLGSITNVDRVRWANTGNWRTGAQCMVEKHVVICADRVGRIDTTIGHGMGLPHGWRSRRYIGTLQTCAM
jgi:hypothetical protein